MNAKYLVFVFLYGRPEYLVDLNGVEVLLARSRRRAKRFDRFVDAQRAQADLSNALGVHARVLAGVNSSPFDWNS